MERYPNSSRPIRSKVGQRGFSVHRRHAGQGLLVHSGRELDDLSERFELMVATGEFTRQSLMYYDDFARATDPAMDLRGLTKAFINAVWEQLQRRTNLRFWELFGPGEPQGSTWLPRHMRRGTYKEDLKRYTRLVGYVFFLAFVNRVHLRRQCAVATLAHILGLIPEVDDTHLLYYFEEDLEKSFPKLYDKLLTLPSLEDEVQQAEAKQEILEEKEHTDAYLTVHRRLLPGPAWLESIEACKRQLIVDLLFKQRESVGAILRQGFLSAPRSSELSANTTLEYLLRNFSSKSGLTYGEFSSVLEYDCTGTSFQQLCEVVFKRMRPEELQAVYTFVTGSRNFDDAEKLKIVHQRHWMDGHLPNARTYFNTLYLPMYSSADRLLQALQTAAAHQGFGDD